MGARRADIDLLFDAVAEALILVDIADRASCDELLAAVHRLADELGGNGHGVAIEPVLFAAEALCAGDESALGDLESAYSAARTAISSAKEDSSAEKKTRESKKRRTAGESEGEKEDAARTMPLAGDSELMRDFGVRAGEHLDDADESLLALNADSGDREAVDAVFRAFHTIKGMAGFLALDAISTLAHDAESMLAGPRNDGLAVDSETLKTLFEAVDAMRELVTNASGVSLVRSDASAESSKPETLEADANDRRTGDDRRRAQRRSEQATATRAGTLRVDGEKLDGLLDAIGELVIAESMVSAEIRSGGDATALAGKLDQLDKITRELQQMATVLRMVPLRTVFRRMARLVHDLAAKSGKSIEFITTGEDTELDKTVVDRIEDPLVHALRNAIDHGIESPEERRAAGKPEAARVELAAFHAGGAIHVEVRDDGRGIDAVRVAEKAAALGLVDGDRALEGRSLLDVLCIPGFSTMDAVTDVSGRGVGMDVVRRTVEELRGRLEVTSEIGSGTTFSVRLPVTLAIIDGMVLRVGGERFIVPLLAIERSVRPKPGDVSTIAGRHEMLAADGQELLPILRLHEVFEVDDAQTDPEQAVIVVVNENGARAGLLACELLGQQQTVIKPLGEGLPDMPGIAGGAVMPDGRVGLILDAAGLVRSAHDRGGE